MRRRAGRATRVRSRARDRGIRFLPRNTNGWKGEEKWRMAADRMGWIKTRVRRNRGPTWLQLRVLNGISASSETFRDSPLILIFPFLSTILHQWFLRGEKYASSPLSKVGSFPPQRLIYFRWYAGGGVIRRINRRLLCFKGSSSPRALLSSLYIFE